VEVEGFTAAWTSQAGDVMRAKSWQKNHQYYKAYRGDEEEYSYEI